LSVFLGIDLGTTCVRVGVVSEDGRMLAVDETVLATRHDAPGRAEQDARSWWPAVCGAAHRAVARSGVPVDAIGGIGLSATSSTVVLLDATDQPLAPAVLWMDVRAAEEAAETAIDHPVLRYSGGSDAAEWLVPKAMWFRRHEPAIWARAVRVVEGLDYLTFLLTGEWVGSLLTATCKWNYDPLGGGFPQDLFATLGIPDLVAKLPGRIAPMGSVAGELGHPAADDLGVPPGIPVAVGGIDAHMAVPGTGAFGGGALCMIGGTSVVLLFLTEHASYGPGIWGPYPEVYGPGTWLLEGGQVSAGSILSWYRDHVGETTHDGLVAAAQRTAPGRTGLLALDYFQGNRTPYRDERLRGGILGLDLHHTPGHVYRALAESVAYGTRNATAAIERLGGEITEVVVAGGIRRNAVWLQATADVLQRPIVLPAEAEASVFGAAVAAAAAAGAHLDLRTAASRMVRRERVVEPDPALRDVYDEGFARYTATTEALAGTLHELARQAEPAPAATTREARP
jgi:ribulose kinase